MLRALVHRCDPAGRVTAAGCHCAGGAGPSQVDPERMVMTPGSMGARIFVLRSTRRRRLDHHRRHLPVADGQRLRAHAGHPLRGADRRVEAHITDAVHARGGLIFLQLMHTGRISHPSLLPAGATPVAPSAIAAEGQVYTATGSQDFVVPRTLDTGEIAGVVDEYRRATRHALQAGFDGVELHAASGYLPEQFLSSGTNRRKDRYGGSPESRARFIIEVLTAMTDRAGSDRTGIKISPEMGFNSVTDAAPQETYRYLVQRLSMLRLAYLHLARTRSAFDYRALARPLFNGPLLLGGGLDRDRAASLIAQRAADAAVFGSLYLANPDLLQRFAAGAPLNAPDRETFYSDGPRGYVDYPVLGQTLEVGQVDWRGAARA